MSIRKQSPSGREAIDIRSISIRVPIQTAHPVVEIINRNKQYIRSISLASAVANGKCPKYTEKYLRYSELFHDF